MTTTRRTALKGLVGGLAGLAAMPVIGAPAIAQARPLKIGILAPRSGVLGTVGECGLRGVQWGVDRINAEGGIAGREVELVIEEETSPRDTIDRLRKLVLQDEVDCVQGLVSSGVSLSCGPVAEQMKALLVMWDGTTQDGVDETMPHPRYVFRSTDNECEAVMASLLTVKRFKGKFAKVAGINPDYSYGRDNWATFLAIMKKFEIDVTPTVDLWPKVGTMDMSSHVAALQAAKPDLIFSSLLVADLPVFMKQGHAAGLFEGTRLVFPAAGFQHTQMKKEYTPEGMIFGHNTLYFAFANASPLQKAFVEHYEEAYKDYPEWEADRAYFAMAVYKAGVEKAARAKGGSWPSQDDIIDAMEGVEVESLGGKGRMRDDHIAEQTFYQGLSTYKNPYDFVTIDLVDVMYADQLQKPPGADFWNWIKEAKFPV
ncbi:MAG TPA: ABC transporter substrate-binding protein [Candidatus Sulfotelmatobacter sp.]|nr:ABC transporter substrate-binding protein [Candidatus Sulfotelmatobacter sp.]